jgi:hypothetical protein
MLWKRRDDQLRNWHRRESNPQKASAGECLSYFQTHGHKRFLSITALVMDDANQGNLGMFRGIFATFSESP